MTMLVPDVEPAGPVEPPVPVTGGSRVTPKIPGPACSGRDRAGPDFP